MYTVCVRVHVHACVKKKRETESIVSISFVGRLHHLIFYSIRPDLISSPIKYVRLIYDWFQMNCFLLSLFPPSLFPFLSPCLYQYLSILACTFLVCIQVISLQIGTVTSVTQFLMNLYV